MVVARRVYLYAIAFAAIWVLINGIAGLLEVALEAVAEAALGPFQSLGVSSIADEVSFYGALAGIGLVVWAIHWGLAARATAHDPPSERASAIRKLYLYGVLLVAGLLLVFQLRKLLGDLLGVAFGTVGRVDLVSGDVLPPLSMLVAAGAFWIYHARQARRDDAIVAERGRAATIRRWCVYLLTFVGLMLLLFGVAGLIARLIDLTVPPDGETVDSGRWLAYDLTDRLSTVLTGLLTWVVAWRRSARRLARTDGPDPERDSVLRKVYVYGVLLIAVSWTVWNLAQVLYVILRSILIPAEAGALWSAVSHDLGETAANVLVFGIAWAYHATVLSREAAAAPEQRRQATIRWIYGYIVAYVGAATFGTGLVGTLATVLELVVQPGVVHGEHWWEEQLALYATMIVVGIPVWLLPWLRLQREVGAAVARRSLARRVYLFLALGATVLTLLGSGAFTLYQILRVALGERWTGSETGDLIDAGSAALVAAILLAYHLRVFQHDAALARQDEPDAPQTITRPEASRDGLVTLVIARAATSEEAAALRTHLEQALPPGTPVETRQVTRAEADRLLGGPA
jgi:hypothetical protein